MSKKEEIEVAVFCVVKKDNKIILGQRNKLNSSSNGMYIAPSGHVEFGESLEDAVRREVMEEANVSINNLRQIEFKEYIKPNKHYILFCYEADYESGEIRGDSDISNPKLYTKKEVIELYNDGKMIELTADNLRNAGWL